MFKIVSKERPEEVWAKGFTTEKDAEEYIKTVRTIMEDNKTSFLVLPYVLTFSKRRVSLNERLFRSSRNEYAK